MLHTFNMDSLKRHKVSRQECLQVISDITKCSYDEELSRRGNIRTMFVGKTEAERTLEIGIEYLTDEITMQEIEHIYHANTAQRETKRKAGYEE